MTNHLRSGSGAGPANSVGYRKPPVHSRFKERTIGKSERPSQGRKESHHDPQQDAERARVVTDNGKRKSITKQEAIYKQLVNKAASGDYSGSAAPAR